MHRRHCSLRRGSISFVHRLWIVLRSTRMQYMMSTMDASTNRKLNRLIRKPSHSNLLLLAIIIRIWERTLENATSQYMTSYHNFYISRCSSQATDVSPITKYLAHYEEASKIYYGQADGPSYHYHTIYPHLIAWLSNASTPNIQFQNKLTGLNMKSKNKR